MQRDKSTDRVLKEFQTAFSHSQLKKADLVRKSGVSYTTFRNWETGRTRSPLMSTMRAALQVMNYEIVVQPKHR